MLVLAGVLLGSVSLSRLEVTLFPDLSPSEIHAWVGYPDAGIHEVEEGVARPIEEVLVGVPGVRGLRTEVLAGGAEFHLRLQPGEDAELVALAVRERLDAVRWELPEGAERPVLLSGVGESPAFILALAAPDQVLASEWAESVLRPRLEQLEGIARAQVVGAPEPEITIVPDAARMNAYGVTVDELNRALDRIDVPSEGGTVRRRGVRYAVELDAGIESAEDVARAIVREGARPLRIRDIADVEDEHVSEEGWSRLDGTPSVGVLVYRSAGTNLVATARSLKEELAQIEGEGAPYQTLLLQDPSPFVEQSISGIWQAVVLGGGLAFLVLAYFLRDARSALVLTLSLPASVLVSFVFFELLDVSLNLMSLGGIALGVGMLVDNGIVCLESIDRFKAKGWDAVEAAGRGAREIAQPILASTLTTCAVFVPLAAVPGPIGGLLRDQAVAVAVSLFVSLILALTFLPTLAARLGGRSSEVRRPGFGIYHRALRATLRHPGLALGSVTLLVLVSVAVLQSRPREILPSMKTDQLEFSLTLPTGTDVQVTDLAAREVEGWLQQRDEVDHVFSSVGTAGELILSPHRRFHRATFFVRLRSGAEKSRAALAASLQDNFADRGSWVLEMGGSHPELETILPRGEAALLCEVTGPDAEVAAALADEMAERANASVSGAGLEVPFRFDREEWSPSYGLRPREESLARLGLSEDQVRRGAESRLSAQELRAVQRFDREIPVTVRPKDVGSPNTGTLWADGRRLPAREVLAGGVILEPAHLLRVDQTRVSRVSWDGPLRQVETAKAALEEARTGWDWPDGYRFEFAGLRTELEETGDALERSLLLSLGLVLLILAAQFESLLLPWFVLVALPLALVGVALGLAVTQDSLNAMSAVGLVVLVGIVVNDAILKVDLLRQADSSQVGVVRAVFQASRQRFRPIIMTTLTTTLALLPVYLGAGHELRAPLATTVIGGLTSATVLTLFVVPVAFVAVATIRRRMVRPSLRSAAS